MSSSVDEREIERRRQEIFLALLTALAVALHTLEALFPSPAPWFRIGFANILTMIALFLFGARAAWSVSLGRILVGSLLLGNLFSPGFLLSLSGGVAATALMCLARQAFGSLVGPVGVSVLGAAGHAAAQILVAWLLLVRYADLWRLFPFFLLFALIAGVLNGLAASAVLRVLRSHPAFALGPSPPAETED